MAIELSDLLSKTPVLIKNMGFNLLSSGEKVEGRSVQFPAWMTYGGGAAQ